MYSKTRLSRLRKEAQAQTAENQGENDWVESSEWISSGSEAEDNG